MAAVIELEDSFRPAQGCQFEIFRYVLVGLA